MDAPKTANRFPIILPKLGPSVIVSVRKSRVRKIQLRQVVDGVMEPYLILSRTSKDDVFRYRRFFLQILKVTGIGPMQEAIGAETPTSARNCKQLFDLNPADEKQIREILGFGDHQIRVE